MISLFTPEQIATAGVLHLTKSAREAPGAIFTGEDRFQDEVILSLSRPIEDEGPNPRICYCPGDDPYHA